MTVAADAEYSKIKAMSEAGEFSHYDDEANTYFVPEMWERIAIRATFGELNALVEWELQNLASGLSTAKVSKKQKGRLRFEMKEIIERIENYYKIEIKEMVGYKEVKTIRDRVNSFKHRKGFKHPDKDACKVIGERFELSREEAFQSIDSVRIFLKDIWSRTKSK
ncbi:MAG: hypothetical protein HY607_00725 [Planctomycetes bacterium]|nr:hypothetical protein [Planctomycetota bacterium]